MLYIAIKFEASRTLKMSFKLEFAIKSKYFTFYFYLRTSLAKIACLYTETHFYYCFCLLIYF